MSLYLVNPHLLTQPHAYTVKRTNFMDVKGSVEYWWKFWYTTLSTLKKSSAMLTNLMNRKYSTAARDRWIGGVGISNEQECGLAETIKSEGGIFSNVEGKMFSYPWEDVRVVLHSENNQCESILFLLMI